MMTTFDGDTYDEQRDGARLQRQLEAVKAVMLDGSYRTLAEIEVLTHHKYPQGSISARLRDLRKARFGSYRVERVYRGSGVYAYRVLPPLPKGQVDLFQVA